MAVKALDVLRSAQQLGIPTDVQKVKDALALFDQDALLRTERDRFEVKVWDKVSDINGVTAEQILSTRDDVSTDGEVYLIYIDGKLTIFQPHVPDQSGFVKMDRNSALSHGANHADIMANDRVNQQVLDKVLETLIG
jgi:hypothetical protein